MNIEELMGLRIAYGKDLHSLITNKYVHVIDKLDPHDPDYIEACFYVIDSYDVQGEEGIAGGLAIRSLVKSKAIHGQFHDSLLMIWLNFFLKNENQIKRSGVYKIFNYFLLRKYYDLVQKNNNLRLFKNIVSKDLGIIVKRINRVTAGASFLIIVLSFIMDLDIWLLILLLTIVLFFLLFEVDSFRRAMYWVIVKTKVWELLALYFSKYI